LTSVLSAQTCEANLKSSGTPKDGLIVTSSVSMHGLPSQSAIGQLKGMIAADAAFDVGTDSYGGGKATLAITQKATGRSREIPMYFTADDQGFVTFKAVLPAGMAMKLADAGSYVCGKWLDRLQTGSRGEALAVAGEKPSPTLKHSTQSIPTTSAAEIASTCEANFSFKGAMFPGGYQYGTYVSVPITEFDAVLRNLKTAAGPGGYKVAEERQDAGQKQMLLTPAKGGNPIVVILDTHNGHFGIGMQAAQGQPLISDAARGVLCSWVGLGTASPDALSAALSQQANDNRGAAPGLESRTAAPAQQLHELRPSSTFNLAEAKAALEPGNSTIRGTGCIRRAGNLILAKNQHVYLYPATPYFREAMDLMTKAKPGKDHLDIDPQAISTRMDGMTNPKGQFQFARMKPGTYYIFTTLESAISGVQDISSGPVWTGPDELTNFHTLVPYTNHYGDILQKYVEIKNDGDSVDIMLTSHIKWSTVIVAQSQSHAGVFGCKDGHGLF
jgi:hypothetical protein